MNLDIIELKPLFSVENGRLSAWTVSGKVQLLAIYTSSGVFEFCLFDGVTAAVRKVPWYTDSVHKPSAVTFSPCGSFLLVVSVSCHLYSIPALTLFDPQLKPDISLDITDITIYPFPFTGRLKSGSSFSRKSSSVSSLSSTENNVDTFARIKDITGKSTEVTGTVVSWWMNHDAQPAAVIGTTTGDIILVDLLTGIRIRETFIPGEVAQLSVCLDPTSESLFLLVRNHEGQHYRIVLEQKAARKGRSRGSSPSDDGEDETPRREYRGRLHGLKQMSVDKLAGIMTKIAETRARAHLKLAIEDTNNKPPCALDPVEIAIKDTNVSLQTARGRQFLMGFHLTSHILSVHTMSLEGNALFVHKLPSDSGECLLGDRLVYVISKDRSQLKVISLHMSKSKMEPDTEFLQDSVVATFSMSKPSNIESHERSTNLHDSERILAIYKGNCTAAKLLIPDEWKVDGLSKLLDNSDDGTECCIVITNHNVYNLRLSSHIVGETLKLILDNHALLQAERMCKIFKMNLCQVLEVSGEIGLARMKIPAAIALLKLAMCDQLKITGKLAKHGHCRELLNYCSSLLSASTSSLSMKALVHISNLLFLSFLHQTLHHDNVGGSHLMGRFLAFLVENNNYDKVLAISLAAQSFQYMIVHKLISQKGLIVEGFTVIVKTLREFARDETLFLAAEDDDFWLCVTDPYLQEAFPCRKEFFPIFAKFLSVRLSKLSVPLLKRLCHLLDPSAPGLRPLARLPHTSEQDIKDLFPMDQLVQLFLVILLVKLSKESLSDSYDKQLMLPELTENGLDIRKISLTDSVNGDSSDESIWPIRKDRKGSSVEHSKSRLLSCGFAHSALIRNGAVITWGSASRGCLGNGSTQMTHASPEPVSWFSTYKLQVSQVSCGKHHTMALTNNGVYGWGSSQYGQLGLDNILESPHPRLIVALVPHRIISVVCGQYHTLALTSSGSLFACGWNVHGQLGLGTVETVNSPTLVHTLKEHVIVDMACGHGHSVVLTDTGHVYTFGSGVFGQLGSGTTVKSSLPVLVKGIGGRVTQIASGYFHNLALTSGNTLYIWGCSPQALRLQAQAHKHARASQNQAAGAEPDPDTYSASSEVHLTPSFVDISNVTGRIAKVACGCHHSALVTEAGDLYTWGRSMDGQLGNGSRTEVVLPSMLKDKTFKVGCVALGSDFSVALEKNGNKVFAWGSNGSGQVGIPIKEAAAKVADGKLIVVKTEKRVVRLPNSLANCIDTPVEVPDIPFSTFTYQSLNGVFSEPTSMPNEQYDAAIWHKTLQKFFSFVNPDLLLCKCLELGNHQAASKLLFLQGQIRQALVHQLKALQLSEKRQQKHRENGFMGTPPSVEKKKVQTPSEEIQLFAVQGGVEEMCEHSDNHENGVVQETNTKDAKDITLLEYIDTAREILLRYLLHAPDSTSDILETAIQFWSAQGLPFSNLEQFLEEHMERVFYQLGCLMYLSKRDLSQNFSPKFQMNITSRFLTHVENNGDCSEFLTVLSRLLSLDSKTTVADISAKLRTPVQKALRLNFTAVSGDTLYVFSCGHTKSRINLPANQEKLAEAYAKLDSHGTVDMACPDCVCSMLSAEVA